MKKVVVVLLMLILVSSVSFAESLDKEYVNLIFDKFASYDEVTKKDNAEMLDIFMSSNKGLDILYSQVLTTKKDTMNVYKISESALKRNFDALKTWSVSDRRALIAAGVAGDKSAVNALNKKNDSYITTPSTDGLATSEVRESLSQRLEKKGLISEAIVEKSELKNKQFKDTIHHWSNEHVNYLVSRGIVEGRDDTTYAPDDHISKAEIVTLITKLIVVEEEKLSKYEDRISDISQGNWYDVYMERAFTLKLIYKNKLGNLQPNHKSTREEVVEILIKTIEALEIPIMDETKTYVGTFKDFDQVTDSAQEEMAIAINLGFIEGMGDGTLAPKNEITRGEIAVVIKKLYIYVMEQL